MQTIKSNTGGLPSLITGGDLLQGAVQGLVVYFANHLSHGAQNPDDVVVDIKGKIIETRNTVANSHSVYRLDENGKEVLLAELPFTTDGTKLSLSNPNTQTGVNRLNANQVKDLAFSRTSSKQFLEPTNGNYQTNDELSSKQIKDLNNHLKMMKTIKVNGQMRSLNGHKGLFLGAFSSDKSYRMIFEHSPIIKLENKIYE